MKYHKYSWDSLELLYDFNDHDNGYDYYIDKTSNRYCDNHSNDDNNNNNTNYDNNENDGENSNDNNDNDNDTWWWW